MIVLKKMSMMFDFILPLPLSLSMNSMSMMFDFILPLSLSLNVNDVWFDFTFTIKFVNELNVNMLISAWIHYFTIDKLKQTNSSQYYYFIYVHKLRFQLLSHLKHTS